MIYEEDDSENQGQPHLMNELMLMVDLKGLVCGVRDKESDKEKGKTVITESGKLNSNP